jgi:hypothetical protein
MSNQLFTKIPRVQAWKNLLSALTLPSLNCIFSVLINFLKIGVTLQSHVMDTIYLLKKTDAYFAYTQC